MSCSALLFDPLLGKSCSESGEVPGQGAWGGGKHPPNMELPPPLNHPFSLKYTAYFSFRNITWGTQLSPPPRNILSPFSAPPHFFLVPPLVGVHLFHPRTWLLS